MTHHPDCIHMSGAVPEHFPCPCVDIDALRAELAAAKQDTTDALTSRSKHEMTHVERLELLSLLDAARTVLRVLTAELAAIDRRAGWALAWASPGDPRRAVRAMDELVDQYTKLDAERARPRPRVEWAHGSRDVWLCTIAPDRERFGGCFPVDRDDTEARAALVDAAEAAGFDVSACREKE